MKIRPATVEDITEIVELGAVLHETSVYRRLPFDKKKVDDLMTAIIGSEYGVVFVAETDSRIIGGIAGGIAEWWFCDVLHAFDYSFFVHSDYRGTSAALRLFMAFEEWAKIKGADEIDVGITTGIHEDKTQRFFEKMGLVQTGRTFGKVLEVGHGR